MTFYEWITSLLVFLSAEPAAIEREAPRSAAAVAVAYAALAHDPRPIVPAKEQK
jgi:hypothetical protein